MPRHLFNGHENFKTDDEPMTNKTWKGWSWKLSKSFEFVTRDAAVVALAFAFLISKVGRQSSNIIL